jgi:hypothetical protein
VSFDHAAQRVRTLQWMNSSIQLSNSDPWQHKNE